MCVRVSKLYFGCRGRACMASREARRKAARERRACLAAAWPTESRGARAHPAAALAAGAAAVAAPAHATQGATREAQRGRAEGDAADAPGHPAEEREAAPLSPLAARARDAAAAAAAGAALAHYAEQHESTSMWLLAERARDGGDPAATILRHCMAGENDVDMSDGSLAPGNFDSASESGKSPPAGGACCLSLAVLLIFRALPCPDSLCLLMAAIPVRASLQSKLFGRASGSAGGSAADPEHAAPATAAPAAKASCEANKRRATAGDAAGSNACDGGAPSEDRPGKRHRTTADETRNSDEAVIAHAALGAAEAEARSAGEAMDVDNEGGDARAASRRLSVHNADPRYAAPLALERADFAKQARSLGLCAGDGCSAAACSRTVRCAPGRE